MQISPHFHRREFACRCGCGFDTVDTHTLEILEAIREEFNAPVIVTSGCRCPDYNRQVGGASHSQHKLARAADIQVQGVDPGLVYDWVAERFPAASLGRYANFTHIDTRSDGPARWEG
ncbi:serine/threonine protein kinase [Halomonas eurihalina]|uniref:Serine/threonine protein kinase n=1 Tax=Halomonas eurihalina TaxID=42566 RepID=A0A5D9DFI9_HALER|nr:D-Ala-D-Ala carboxypeptidase family metallohydrolase [Halomonas eurihalina]MDR5857935.1 D-Ala-D-Ala carboxypeptidase family metallohydrolase [Halomonas eurihalina]TZG41551.1 serine/threonine protein kinase [Halomonas eurihalina]